MPAPFRVLVDIAVNVLNAFAQNPVVNLAQMGAAFAPELLPDVCKPAPIAPATGGIAIKRVIAGGQCEHIAHV